MEDFSELLRALELFEGADEENKWKRCLVCGICRIPQGIAVNTTQLKRLVFKCKSSINGSLKGLGFTKIVTSRSAHELLFKQIPYLRDHRTELRQWTIRVCPAADHPGGPAPDFATIHDSQTSDSSPGDLTDLMYDSP